MIAAAWALASWASGGERAFSRAISGEFSSQTAGW